MDGASRQLANSSQLVMVNCTSLTHSEVTQKNVTLVKKKQVKTVPVLKWSLQTSPPKKEQNDIFTSNSQLLCLARNEISSLADEQKHSGNNTSTSVWSFTIKPENDRCGVWVYFCFHNCGHCFNVTKDFHPTDLTFKDWLSHFVGGFVNLVVTV